MEENEVIIGSPDLITVFSRQHDLNPVLQDTHISLHALNEVRIDNHASLHLQEAVIQLLLNVRKSHVRRTCEERSEPDDCHC